MPSVLVLTGGVVEAVGPGGRREIAASDFFEGSLETTLAHDELIEAVLFGLFEPSTRTAFEFCGPRCSGDYALAGVAVAVEVVDGAAARPRASFVSVTPVPTVFDLHARAGGCDASPVPAAVAELVRGHVDPEADIHASADYRRMLAAERTLRALASALRRSTHVEGAA